MSRVERLTTGHVFDHLFVSVCYCSFCFLLGTISAVGNSGFHLSLLLAENWKIMQMTALLWVLDPPFWSYYCFGFPFPAAVAFFFTCRPLPTWQQQRNHALVASHSFLIVILFLPLIQGDRNDRTYNIYQTIWPKINTNTSLFGEKGCLKPSSQRVVLVSPPFSYSIYRTALCVGKVSVTYRRAYQNDKCCVWSVENNIPDDLF